MKAYERWVDRAARSVGLQVSRVSSVGARLPREATANQRALIDSLRPFTMTSAERLWTLTEAVRYIHEEGLPGAFVECGVWRGGSIMAMAQQLRELDNTDREIWLYDTFAGMTDPTSEDVEADTGTTASSMLETTPVEDGNNVWCVAGLEDVKGNVFSTGYPQDRFVFIEGDVAETLDVHRPGSIALLRLDTDWYASTKRSLEVLYPLLQPGGVCILDDYGHWEGARKAVDEYFSSRYSRPFMQPIDYSGRVFIKPASHT